MPPLHGAGTFLLPLKFEPLEAGEMARGLPQVAVVTFADAVRWIGQIWCAVELCVEEKCLIKLLFGIVINNEENSIC